MWPVAGVSLYLFPYSVQLNNPNERTRVLQARAIVEHGQLHIGEVFHDRDGRSRVRDLYGRVTDEVFVNDVGLVCEVPGERPPKCAGRIYPAKAPGTALLGAPALALGGALGFVPTGPAGETRATWLLRVGGVLPFLLLGLLLVGRELERLGAAPVFIARALLAVGLGTTLFPYSLVFVGHATASVALLLGLVFMRAAADAHPKPFFAATLAGLAASWAVLLEYHAVVAVFTLGCWALFSARRKWLVPGYVAGGLGGLAVHASLHIAMFKSPLRTGHAFLMTAHNREGQTAGYLGMDGFHWRSLHDHLTDTYMGVVPIMPWVALGFALGCISLYLVRGQKASFGMLTTSVAMVCTYLLFVGTLARWRDMNGWSIGPRYLTPCLFPAALVAVYGWWSMVSRSAWIARLCAGFAGASLVIVVSITGAYPSPPQSVGNTFAEIAVPLLTQGYGVRNVLMSLGSPSLWLLGGALLAMGLWVAFGPDEARSPWPRGQRLAFGLGGLVWLLLLGSRSATPKDELEAAQSFCRATGEGVRPGQATSTGFFR